MSQHIAPLTTEVASNVLDTFGKLLRVLEKEGVQWEHLCLPMNDRTARHNLAAFLQAGCPAMMAANAGGAREAPPTAAPPREEYAQAITILGDDFIAPEEVAGAHNCAYTREQLAQFAATVPGKDVLEWCREKGFMLVAGPPTPLCLFDIRELCSPFSSGGSGWYAESRQAFSREQKVTMKWLMLRKEPVPGSLGKTWKEQVALLSPVEYVPNAAEVEWAVTTYKAARNIFLLRHVYVRTSSVAAGGIHVGVGYFNAEGWSLENPYDNHYYARRDAKDDSRRGDRGLASARNVDVVS